MLAHGTWLGWLGVQVPKLPLAVQGEWGLVKRYFRFGMGLEKWGRINGLSYLLPSLSEISHSIRQGCQGDAGDTKELSWQSEHHAFEGGGTQSGRLECHSRVKSHKNALTWAHFNPCWWMTWEFLVFSCPSHPLFFHGWGKGVFGGAWFPKHLASSCHTLKWQFHYLECKVEHLLGIFFYIFCKALHMRGCREVFIKHFRTFPLSIRKQKNK